MRTYINKLIRMGLKEDLDKSGDVTSLAIFLPDKKTTYYLIAKDTGILCGRNIFEKVFEIVDKKVSVNFFFQDSDIIKPGDCVAEITGSVISLLTAERTALNFISHLSGIASETKKYVDKVKNKAVILDTRKTIPGYRYLHKYAVACGGGHNHRMGLFDMIMIKDNHIDAAGGITKAVNAVKNKWGKKYKIEVETRNLDEVNEALKVEADRIMLDNMDIKTMKKAINIIDKKAETEASGNMTLDRISEVAATGVQYISVGALTHSVKAFDFSLRKEC